MRFSKLFGFSVKFVFSGGSSPEYEVRRNFMYPYVGNLLPIF